MLRTIALAMAVALMAASLSLISTLDVNAALPDSTYFKLKDTRTRLLTEEACLKKDIEELQRDIAELKEKLIVKYEKLDRKLHKIDKLIVDIRDVERLM